jgi:hypothetical protein
MLFLSFQHHLSVQQIMSESVLESSVFDITVGRHCHIAFFQKEGQLQCLPHTHTKTPLNNACHCTHDGTQINDCLLILVLVALLGHSLPHEPSLLWEFT